MATGFLIGLVMGIGEEGVFVGRGRWRRYLWVTVVRVLLYTGVIVAALVLVNGASEALAADTRLLGGMATYVTGESMLRDLVLASMVAVVGITGVVITLTVMMPTPCSKYCGGNGCPGP